MKMATETLNPHKLSDGSYAGSDAAALVTDKGDYISFSIFLFKVNKK